MLCHLMQVVNIKEEHFLIEVFNTRPMFTQIVMVIDLMQFSFTKA